MRINALAYREKLAERRKEKKNKSPERISPRERKKRVPREFRTCLDSGKTLDRAGKILEHLRRKKLELLHYFASPKVP